ncbi:unnamed protein product [Ceutorhynchus assimilis]|uniref:Apoptosis inhibitor 5 n=1 Tax=Ceutorhynchus assimilis TaxID=467358 RepID=A0A9P0GM79_9CUCU|nr:unnamed protein product [Ceutorhynchus assimilis]
MEDEGIGDLPKLVRNFSTLLQALVGHQLEQNSHVYQECIQGVKDSWPANKLTIQIISKFYKHFPHLQQQSLDCVLDLCENDDGQTRMHAIKYLSIICKDNLQDASYFAYLLSQFLQLGLPDYITVCDSLGHLFKLSPLDSLDGIFKNISEIEEGAVRDKTVDFIYSKLTKILIEKSDQQKVDELLLSKARHMVKDCSISTDEFMILMTYLVNTSWAKLQGQQEIFQIIEDKIEIIESFQLDDVDCLDICMELIMPLFNNNGDSSRFVNYYCQKVLPKLQEILSLRNGDQYQIELLKQLTLMSSHCKKISIEALDCLLASLKEFIPVVPVDESPNLDFCNIECLLYTFHNLCKILPEFLLNDSEKLNGLRTNLQYLTFIVGDWDQTLKTKKYCNLKKTLSQVDKIKLDLSLKIFDNLLEISKDFFNQPPVYNASVQLSFTVVKCKIEIQETPTRLLTPPPPKAKRPPSPITFDLAKKTSQESLQVVASNHGGRGLGNRGRGNQGGWGRGQRGGRGWVGNWGHRGQRGRGQTSA